MSFASQAEPAPRGMPRPIGCLGIAVFCGLLTAIFVFQMLPYDRFRPALTQQLTLATGARVEIGSLGAGLGLGGPALVAREVRLSWPGEPTPVELSQVRVRPAWTFSWLKGEPAAHVDVRGPLGRVAGTVWPGSPGFDGRLEQIDLTALPTGLSGGKPLPLTGTLDAELDLASLNGQIAGDASLEATDGAIALGELPVAIPFGRLTGEIERAEDGATALRDIALTGPMLSFDAAGSVGGGPLERAPLDITIELRDVDPSLISLLTPLGIRLDPSGSGTLKLSGTLSRPILR